MAKKTKIPKKIAGVKVPKALRRGLRDLAASQTGRAALVEALAAADAALTPPKTAEAAGSDAKAPSARARKKQATDAQATTVAALEDGARAFTEALRRPERTEAPPQATTPPSASTH